MADWGTAVGSIVGWFSPEQRAKAKRSKLEALKQEREDYMKFPCNADNAKRVYQIDKQIEIIDRDLRS